MLFLAPSIIQEPFNDGLLLVQENLRGATFKMAGKCPPSIKSRINGQMVTITFPGEPLPGITDDQVENNKKVKVDCSGYTCVSLATAMKNVNLQLKDEIFTPQLIKIFDERDGWNNSEAVITQLAQRTGNMNTFSYADLPSQDLPSATVIGIDSGPAGHDKGRKIGIDHIVNIATKNGVSYVFESASSKGGVAATTLSKWIADPDKKNWKFFAVNPLDCAKGAAMNLVQAAPGGQALASTTQAAGFDIKYDSTIQSGHVARTDSSGTITIPADVSLPMQAASLVVQMSRAEMAMSDLATEVPAAKALEQARVIDIASQLRLSGDMRLWKACSALYKHEGGEYPEWRIFANNNIKSAGTPEYSKQLFDICLREQQQRSALTFAVDPGYQRLMQNNSGSSKPLFGLRLPVFKANYAFTH